MTSSNTLAVSKEPRSGADQPFRQGTTLHIPVIPTRSGGIPLRSWNSGRPDTATRGMSRSLQGQLDVTDRLGEEGKADRRMPIPLTGLDEDQPC